MALGRCVFSFLIAMVTQGVALAAGPSEVTIPVTEETPLQLLVFERAPYYKAEPDGSYVGLVATPTTQALERANIPYTWVPMQPNGHMRAIEANEAPMCAVGWFKRPAREEFGQFSDIIYTDQPSNVLTRVDNKAVQAHKTARDLMADATLRMGDKLGYSHGAYLDQLLDELAPPRATVALDETGLARMLLGGRFDYMVVSEVEAVVLMEEFGAAGEDIVLLTMADIPPGNDRYLICTRVTEPALIDRFNDALDSLK